MLTGVSVRMSHTVAPMTSPSDQRQDDALVRAAKRELERGRCFRDSRLAPQHLLRERLRAFVAAGRGTLRPQRDERGCVLAVSVAQHDRVSARHHGPVLLSRRDACAVVRLLGHVGCHTTGASPSQSKGFRRRRGPTHVRRSRHDHERRDRARRVGARHAHRAPPARPGPLHGHHGARPRDAPDRRRRGSRCRRPRARRRGRHLRTDPRRSRLPRAGRHRRIAAEARGSPRALRWVDAGPRCRSTHLAARGPAPPPSARARPASGSSRGSC